MTPIEFGPFLRGFFTTVRNMDGSQQIAEVLTPEEAREEQRGMRPDQLPIDITPPGPQVPSSKGLFGIRINPNKSYPTAE